MEKIKDNLSSYDKFQIKLGLENMQILMKALGNPDENYKIIHIAGTNGKGSTASFIEAGLIEAGFKTGKYTSPEIFSFNERITVNKEEISDVELEEYSEKLEKIISDNEIEVTFFEITTALMFLYMKDKKVDYLVLETGLGGRLDATNIVMPELSLITNISYDHTDFLGDTLEKIAYEKAGIIKDKVPVFFSDNKKELLDAVRDKTDNYINVLKKYNLETELDRENFKTVVKLEKKEFELSLFGEHQVKNFLLAYEALKYLGIADEVIKKALKKVTWKGRFELVSKNPFVILDGAHNEDAARALSSNIEKLFNKNEVVLIISILKDKDVDSILKNMNNCSDTAIFTGIDNVRGLSADEMYKAGKSYFNNSHEKKSLGEALEFAKALGKKAVIICGSFYLLKEYNS